MELTEKLFVIVGGGSGIGAAIARKVARAGAIVVVCDISTRNLERLCLEISNDGGRVFGYLVDVSDGASVDALAKIISDKHGPPDHLLISVVDYSKTMGDISYIETNHWQSAFDVNFFGYIRVLEHFIPLMRGSVDRTIAITSSTLAIMPDFSMPIHMPYSSLKHALFGLATALQVSFAAANETIRVICFCPSATATENAIAGVEGTKHAHLQGAIAAGAAADDVANAFIDGLARGGFLICTQPGYEDGILELANCRLDPLHFLQTYKAIAVKDGSHSA